MSLSAPSAPTPYDPSQINNQQLAGNVAAGVGSAYLNHPNVYTPYGSTQNQVNGYTDIGGFQVPNFSQVTSLSPGQQTTAQNVTGVQNAMSGLALDALGRRSGDIASSLTPIDFSSLPGYGGVPGLPGASPTFDPQAFQKNAVDAVYGQATSRLDPQFAQWGNQLDQRLADQGIPVGNDAYQKQQDSFNRGRNDAYQGAMTNAITQGSGIANNLFGEALGQAGQQFNQGLQANQQGYNEAQGQRQQALSEQQMARQFPLQQLMTVAGMAPSMPQVGMPSYPGSSIAPPNIAAGYSIPAQQQQQSYNANAAQSAAGLGGVAGLAGTLLNSGLTQSANGTPGWLAQAGQYLWNQV